MQAILQRKPLEPAITLQSTDSTAMKCVLVAIFHWPHLRNHPELWDERHDGGKCCLQTFSTHRLPGRGPAFQGQERRSCCFHTRGLITSIIKGQQPFPFFYVNTTQSGNGPAHESRLRYFESTARVALSAGLGEQT